MQSWFRLLAIKKSGREQQCLDMMERFWLLPLRRILLNFSMLIHLLKVVLMYRNLAKIFNDRDITIGEGAVLCGHHFEIHRFYDRLVYGRRGDSERGEGIAFCRTKSAKSGEFNYAVITYVFPTISARAVPMLQELCDQYGNYFHHSFSPIFSGPSMIQYNYAISPPSPLCSPFDAESGDQRHLSGTETHSWEQPMCRLWTQESSMGFSFSWSVYMYRMLRDS